MTPQELDAILQRARELQAQQQGGVDQQAAEYAAAGTLSAEIEVI